MKTRQNWLAFLASAQAAPLIATPERFRPMLAEGGWEPFDDDDWWFEPKLDGIRCLAELGTGETTLRTRTGRDVTEQYPELHMVHELVEPGERRDRRRDRGVRRARPELVRGRSSTV